MLAALATLLSARVVVAQVYNQLIVFGDSSVDSGYYRALANPGANAAYNGDWAAAVAAGAGTPVSRPGLTNAELLAAYLGLTLLPANQPGGTNYATSGAKNTDVNTNANGGFKAAIPTVTQMQNYLQASGGAANHNALYLISSGGNDVSFAVGGSGNGPFPTDPTGYVNTAATNLAAAIALLKSAGAQQFIVANLASSFPTSDANQQALKASYNQTLFASLASQGVTVIEADVNALRVAFANNPGLYGFASVNTATGDPACTVPSGVTSAWALLCSSKVGAPSGFISANADFTQLFADDQHLATAGQEYFANYYYSLLAPAGPSPLVAAVLPSSRSVQIGNTASAFVTIVNAGAATATGCQFWPLADVPGRFSFQTTDPATNNVTGTPNTPVTISAGGAQTFVLAFSPAIAAFAPTDVPFVYVCAGTAATPSIVGVNTLLLSFSSSAVPDIVALAASGDPGVVDIPGGSGTGVFAVATVNVGAAGTITAAADTGAATLPVVPTICQTVPAAGVCMAAPAASVTVTISADATPTFGIFTQGSANVPFDPGNNRVFVRFKDAGGVTRGSTSVAVRTQ